MEPNREVDVARNVGLGDITFFSQVGYGGGAGCGVVGQAAMAVATGQCEVAVAWRARKRAAKASRPWAQVAAAHRRATGSGAGRSGMLRPVDEIAMLTRRYMHEYGAHARPPRQRRARVPQAREPQPGRRRWATSR